ncbi:hypothetical protein E1B28_000032 [Marasmius oreades]|uniref:Uncharacterized protein n=1 Tax=Marasmius oreades TaxID=181124 RepID=A0A9P7V0K4_9AGAR|nr:uncharacterized protein E1B28_000032 [Marasmius oreades]KAG7098058.1 hypothetical protein E1B28_000032 [Marasmius oreades]
MQLQSLFSLSFSLASFLTGAPNATFEDTHSCQDQAVTIQQFPLIQPGHGQTQQDTVQELTEAMSKLKATSGMKLEHAYVGVIDSNIAEQIFLWTSVAEASTVDTIKPFTSFSSTGSLNSSTSVFNDKATLLRSLEYPIIETGVVDILPNVSTIKVERDEAVIIESILKTGLALGGPHGVQHIEGRRTFMMINGWNSSQAVAEWAEGVMKDPVISQVYHELCQYFVGGPPTVLFKSMTEVL